MTAYPTREEIAAYLAEDVGSGDLTATIIPESAKASAKVVTREGMVLCGREWFDAVFRQIEPSVQVAWYFKDGDEVAADSLLCQVQGSARALLTGERTALNVLQTLSATASLARRYAKAVDGTGCKVLDTRKTLPGLRLAQKYAVKCGGCVNHRIGLFDAVLIKENHIIASGSIQAAVSMARTLGDVMVEIEVESLDELQQALDCHPDRIMLDNFSIDQLKQAVAVNNRQAELEASGNITLDNIRSIAETGVDYISIGALTKNLKAIDLSMRIELSVY